MTDIVVSTDTDSVVAVSTSTNVVALTQIEPVLISTEMGSFITIGSESTVVVESVSGSVVVTGVVGPPGLSEDDIVYSKRIDFITESELYRAEAIVGASENNGLWRIRKIVIGTDGDVSETWAGGNALFDKVWADRATLIYS